MQNESNLPICQVVGYKNTGKTTLMNRLIFYFTDNGLRVSTLKHHGHGGEPDRMKHTDSYQHMESGSIISAVQGERQFHMTVQDTEKLALSDLLSLYNILPLDLLLIEGYKNADYPKIVLLRSEADKELLTQLTNIIAVGYWHTTSLQTDKYFTFAMKEIEAVLPHLAGLIQSYLS